MMITSPKQHWTIIYKLCMTDCCVFTVWGVEVDTLSGMKPELNDMIMWQKRLVMGPSLFSCFWALSLSLSISQTTCQCHSLTHRQNAACTGNAAWTTVASSAQCVNVSLSDIFETPRTFTLSHQITLSRVRVPRAAPHSVLPHYTHFTQLLSSFPAQKKNKKQFITVTFTQKSWIFHFTLKTFILIVSGDLKVLWNTFTFRSSRSSREVFNNPNVSECCLNI